MALSSDTMAASKPALLAGRMLRASSACACIVESSVVRMRRPPRYSMLARSCSVWPRMFDVVSKYSRSATVK